MSAGLGNETAARAERDDDRGHVERATQAMEVVMRERVQRLFGEAAPIHECDEFGFVGHKDIGVIEDAVVEVGAHRRGIEDRGDAGATGGAEDVSVHREVGLVLADDDAGAAHERGGHVAWGECGVGAEGDDNLVFAVAVDENGRVAGGEFFPGQVDGDAFGAEKGFGLAAEVVVAQRADKRGGAAGAGGGDGLVGTLAARSGLEATDDGRAGCGKIGAGPGEVLVVAADDDDGGFHRVKLRGADAR